MSINLDPCENKTKSGLQFDLTMVVAVVQDALSQLLTIVGLDEANLKVLVCTLLSFPFSWIFKRLPDHRYSLKNVYNILVSAFYVFVILDVHSGVVQLLISALGCYFITRYVRSPVMPWINFLFLMGHLFYEHIHMQFFNVYDSTQIDLTGAQMVMVMKLSAFGWNVHDGKQPEESLTEYNKLRRIKQHPNLLPFFGYVFFYASLLTGPAFDYVDYDHFIHGRLFEDVPDDKRPGKRKRRIPRSGKQSLMKTLEGFFWAFCFANIGRFVTVEYLLTKSFVQDHGFLYRIFYSWVLLFSYRLKYYAVWSIAEGACILSGIGYNGYDQKTGKFKWNRVQNIDAVAFETGQNVHACLEAWNMNTNKWLKHYIYLRVAKSSKKPGFKSTLFTFAASAAWHGTRPGYYLTFVSGALMQSCGKIYRRNFRPIFMQADGKTPKSTKIVYDVICYFVTQLTFGQATQPFVILDFKQSLYAWSTCYYFIHIGMIVTLFLFKGPFAKPVIKTCKSFQASAKVAPNTTSSKFNEQEAGIVKSTALKTKMDTENVYFTYATLGLPSIDMLESVDKEDVDDQVKQLRKAWLTFKARSVMQNVEDTFHNFTEEVQDIYASSIPKAVKND